MSKQKTNEKAATRRSFTSPTDADGSTKSVMRVPVPCACQCYDRSDMFLFCLRRQRVLLLRRQLVRRVVDSVAAHGHVQRIGAV